MAEVYAPRDGLSGPRNPKWCAAGVQKDWSYTQCSRAIQVEENGFGWCGIHSSAHEKKVEEARDRKYKEYTDKNRHAQHLRDVGRAYVEFGPVAVALLERFLIDACDIEDLYADRLNKDCGKILHDEVRIVLRQIKGVLNGSG